MTTHIISISSHVRKIITVASIEYGLGKIGNSYFVMNMDSETWRSFTSPSAFNWFVETLIEAGERIEAEATELTPIAIHVRETAHVYAAEVATRTDHLIRIAAPADVTTCESCRETLPGGRDSRLCATCEAKQAEIVTPAKRTAHIARNELRALFTQIMSNEQYKARRAELLEEIATLEAAEKAAHLGAGTSSYLYHKTSAEDAIADFEKRFGCKPTQMRISKYDSADDIDGIDIARTGAVLPGDLWLGAR
jgi:hypothetical protein